ncbi:MAG TPA: AMP-binding protein, partial [Deltaproteobacteria bacterium]|nr:AMP-binding protein [Deltaproteobacteria bacterium]
MSRVKASGIKMHADVLDRLETMTLPQVLIHQAQAFGSDPPAIREKAYGIWQTYTWQDYLDYVRLTAYGLKALGLKRHDNVAMVVNNHPEWLFCQLGSQAMGAVTLNLFTSAVASEIASTLKRVNARIVIVQDQEQTDKILEQSSNLPHLEALVYVDPTGMRGYAGNRLLVSYKDLLELGKKHELRHPGLFVEEVSKGKPSETAHMILTSGTTGVSKLAMLSHRNYTAMARQWIETAPVTRGGNWLSMTPPAWIVDQMWAFGVALMGGMTMNFPETPETVTEDFREIGPELLITSSR